MSLVDTFIYHIPKAVRSLFKAVFYIEPHVENYIVNLFYFADILVNTLAGGNHRVTVSARCGYNAEQFRNANNYKTFFWSFCEKVIDFTFLPMDGKGHCRQAKEWTVAYLRVLEGDNDPDIYQGPAWVLYTLMVFIIASCIFLIPLLRVGKFLKLY